jgi:RNA polymerase sigma-70 factor (ECF subfamily)
MPDQLLYLLHPQRSMSNIQEVFGSELLENRAQFLGFVMSRVDDEALAEDILQDSLLKALKAAPELKDQDRLVPWFFQIVRNAITDTYRRRAVSQRGLDRFAETESEGTLTPAEESALCECFRGLLPGLKPEYSHLIESMDLGGATSSEMAEQLGITANNLKVRHHRARQQLRSRLEATCGVCAEHGCTDCSCKR